ncbi:protein neprosin-like [Malania oleifera]|uniref:protein neprosin-like n=1 Tax=Malania oleifera TaxID=397392 RepID=UPI0025AE23A7|nr:protein neprosin-like [Malania oleifera]
MSALLGFHQRTKAIDESSQGEGLVVKGNQDRGKSRFRSGPSNNRARSRSTKRKVVQCFKCRKKGHIKPDCLERKKGNAENKEDGQLPTKSNPLSRQNLLEVKTRIDFSQKHAVKSIESEDGDIIDCIDIYKQPAFHHPALRNHTIQMSPSYDQTVETTTTMTLRKGESAMIVSSQLWQRNGSCPEGTVPIRRIQRSKLFKSNKTDNYVRKKGRFSYHFKHPNIGDNSYLQQINHSLAVLLTEGYSYSGAKGDIKVWNPYVESDDEYSTSQVCLKNGPYYDYESIESGWAVNPKVYGDKQTRLFVYWTADGSKTTGCFDLTCPGFVQTSNEIALGSTINPISVPGGLPYQITLYIFKDPNTSNWWVQYGERINIGYWPPDLFRLLRHNAESVEWGGEVYSSKVGSAHHTATAMGNGQFSDPIFGNSGSIKRIRIRENSFLLKFPEWVDTYSDEYNCYDVSYLGDYIEDPEFYYGGPGRNPKCP